MILSSRNSPRLSLRRAASYNNDKGPLSSTSSRFSFNHLIADAPPSPGLPALIPRHGKAPVSTVPRKWVRGALWLSGVFALLYFAGSTIRKQSTPLHRVGWASDAGSQYEIVGGDLLPDYPTPVVVEDKRGRSKWTVSIPVNHEFPLSQEDYADICTQNMEVATHVADLHTHMHKDHAAHYDYYRVDPNFMDVREAEDHGLLPGPEAKTSSFHGQEGSVVGDKTGSLIESDVCEKSMTFVLETADAGLGKTLMMLWTAYGLAEKEGRSFFIDDSRWAYGKWTSFFQPPPMPACRPPPRHEILPCPHHARHLVVSAATAAVTFGGAFNEHFEDPRKMEVYRQKPVYDMARLGYEKLFNLITGDAEYVSQRVHTLQAKTQITDSLIDDGLLVGIHVRHGDRHPLDFQYRDSYIPLETYLSAAQSIIATTFNSTSSATEDASKISRTSSVIVVASDDPDVYTAETFSSTLRAQELIRLASRSSIYTPPEPTDPGPRKFVEESVGWEGGFFAPMFWSLGRPSALPKTGAEQPSTSVPATEEALRLRELVGRAYLMDLAVLGASDRIVCTVSSMGCKMLGVMMGWEKMVELDGWKNVDGDWEWRGVEW